MVFWTFAGVGVVAWLFVVFKLPETRGVPIEHIQHLFASGDRFADQPPPDTHVREKRSEL
jgi:hypothetical protein